MADHGDFALVAETMRAKIHGLCYRMTGSFHDSEDLTQEALFLASSGFSGFRGESAVETWMYRIATNLCLSFLRTRKRRGLPGPGHGVQYHHGDRLPEPTDEPVWLEPCPTPEDILLRREHVSLAFLALVQTLPPRQRAIFILVRLLEYTAKDAAAIMGCTETAVNSALQRARKSVGSFNPVDAVVQDDVSQVLEQYVSAWESGDIEALLALVRADAVMVMPPYPVWVQGKNDIARVLLDYPFKGAQEWKLVPTVRANGDFAFGFYKSGPGPVWQGWGVQVLTLENKLIGPERIRRIYVFRGEELLSVFGLPSSISRQNRRSLADSASPAAR